MNNEEKIKKLFKKINVATKNAFDGWEWDVLKQKPLTYIIGCNNRKEGFAFFLSSNEDTYNGLVWFEYTPEDDMLELKIKYAPIKERFVEDIKVLFEKYKPFNMTISFEKGNIPLLSRKEQIKPEEFLDFYAEFKAQYVEYQPLFDMIMVSEKDWYEKLTIIGTDC